MGSSFEVVNYSLRPNKAVERRLIFRTLSEIAKELRLDEYHYLGMGSMWFVDFVLAHKVLGITALTSIEGDDYGRSRAKFNKPYSCVEVVSGDTSKVIPELDLESKPLVAWLDYDTSIDGPVIPDLTVLLGRVPANSIVLVTINARLGSLNLKDRDGIEIGVGDCLRRIAGDYVPNPLDPKDLSVKRYPQLLSKILKNCFAAVPLHSGREVRFLELFDISYSDGVAMVTVGGILLLPEEHQKFEELRTQSRRLIGVPPLTLKEKFALDQLLPSAVPLSEEKVEAAAGFRLKARQIDAYREYYALYSTFGEILF